MEKLFWLGLIVAILVWYAIATVLVAIRGAGNIRTMLKTLGALENKTAD